MRLHHTILPRYSSVYAVKLGNEIPIIAVPSASGTKDSRMETAHKTRKDEVRQTWHDPQSNNSVGGFPKLTYRLIIANQILLQCVTYRDEYSTTDGKAFEDNPLFH